MVGPIRPKCTRCNDIKVPGKAARVDVMSLRYLGFGGSGDTALSTVRTLSEM